MKTSPYHVNAATSAGAVDKPAASFCSSPKNRDIVTPIPQNSVLSSNQPTGLKNFLTEQPFLDVGASCACHDYSKLGKGSLVRDEHVSRAPGVTGRDRGCPH